MRRARIVELVRNFPQNGMKLLLETPANVRELLTLVAPAFVELIDFDRMKPQPTDFITRDYRHVEADVVLRAPARRPLGGRGRRNVIIYILIEHQSEPDRLMPLRLLDYVTQIYRLQIRSWSRGHDTFTGFHLDPVLPLVLYTGDRPWPTVGTLTGLMDVGDRFAAVTPGFTPLFLNLPATPDVSLREGGGAFGSLLRLFRDRSADEATFAGRLSEVVAELEKLPQSDRLRWLECLSYVHAMVYHVRDTSEHSALTRLVESSVATDSERRAEMAAVHTMAMVAEEKGALEYAKNSLIRSLTLRFGDLPDAVVERIRGTDKIKILDKWIESFVTARKLADIGILPPKSSRS